MPGFIESKSKPFWFDTCSLMVVVIGIVDCYTGYEVGFSLFYVGPISLVAWRGGRWYASLISFESAIIWSVADFWSGHPYSHPLYLVWNSLVRLGFFMIIAHLLISQRRFMERETAFARTDFVTGAPNGRQFYDVVASELSRSSRSGRPLTVAYIDLDNFKIANDRYGHAAGDEALRKIAGVLASHMRGSDLAARLGGDEFALMLPETGAEDAAKIIARLRAALHAAMKDKDWPITFSIGVITCIKPPQDVDSVVHMADELMYSVKSSGKNAVAYSTYEG